MFQSKYYCIVPKCKNTTVSTPEKMFFAVPKDIQVRNKWTKAMMRTHPILGTVHCCEDHFDIKNDMKINAEYNKPIEGLLKEGVIPHKFKCQEMKGDEPERSTNSYRRFIDKLIYEEPIPSASDISESLDHYNDEIITIDDT